MLHESEKTWKAFTSLSRKTRVIWWKLYCLNS